MPQNGGRLREYGDEKKKKLQDPMADSRWGYTENNNCFG